METAAENERALITLTTDFGTAGGYVGAIKGRILSDAPHAVIHDISHQIAPCSVLDGAWCLGRAAPQATREWDVGKAETTTIGGGATSLFWDVGV